MVNHANPVRTVDAQGNQISLDTKEAAPIKTVDSIGRSIDHTDAPRDSQEAQAIQELEKAEEVPKNPDAEARKLFLQAQKAKRRADESEKKASASLAKAEAFERAISLAQSGEDPTAVLTAAGLDPIKFYQNMTTYALSDKNKTEDPVKKELREHKERLDKYAADLEVQANTIKSKEEAAAHNQVITQTVIPMLQANADKYETLLMEYGANTAIEVYKTVWEIYQSTGKARKFEEVADEMEKYWSDKVEAGIINASKMKKFQNRFSQSNSETSRNASQDHQDIPTRSPTLSNKQVSQPLKKSSHYQTRDERVAEIMKKFGS